MNVPVRIEAEAWSDVRFMLLAQVMGYADADHAVAKVAKVWGWQTLQSRRVGRPVHHVPDVVVEVIMGKGAVAALTSPEVDLAVREADGLYMRGTRKPGRISWLLAYDAGDAGGNAGADAGGLLVPASPASTSKRQPRRSAGGTARATGAVRIGGRFAAKTSNPPASGDLDQHPTSNVENAGTSKPASSPATDQHPHQHSPASPAVLTLSPSPSSEREAHAGDAGPVRPAKPAELASRYAIADQLFERQESLRREVDPQVYRPANKIHTTDAIVKLLAVGERPEDLHHVLEVYAHEARQRPADKLKFFNGHTHWQPAQVERAKSSELPGTSAPVLDYEPAQGAPGPRPEHVGELTPEQQAEHERLVASFTTGKPLPAPRWATRGTR